MAGENVREDKNLGCGPPLLLREQGVEAVSKMLGQTNVAAGATRGGKHVRSVAALQKLSYCTPYALLRADLRQEVEKVGVFGQPVKVLGLPRDE
jgi:hypothetical protein